MSLLDRMFPNSNRATMRRYDRALDPSTPAEVLAEFAADGSALVQAAVASNPSTPTEVLADMAGGADEYVQPVLAENPNTPPEVLAKLAAGTGTQVALSVVNNPATPPEVLAQLARHPDWRVRHDIAWDASGAGRADLETHALLSIDDEFRVAMRYQPHRAVSSIQESVGDLTWDDTAEVETELRQFGEVLAEAALADGGREHVTVGKVADGSWALHWEQDDHAEISFYFDEIAARTQALKETRRFHEVEHLHAGLSTEAARAGALGADDGSSAKKAKARANLARRWQLDPDTISEEAVAEEIEKLDVFEAREPVLAKVEQSQGRGL